VFVGNVASAGLIEKGPLRIEHSDLDVELAQQAATVLEKAIADNASRLPVGDAPIHIVICHTLAEFGRYAGFLAMPSVSGIAEPENGFIAVKTPALLQGPESFAGILRHELFHVLLARNIKSANLPHWLNEGIAMRYSGEYRWETAFRIAEMYLQGTIISYTDIAFVLDAGKGERAFGDAYAQSLSMTTYLLDLMGEDRFWAMVHSLNTQSFGDAMRGHLGMSPGAFYDAWRRSLWKVAVVSSLVSGFGLFQLMAFLTVWAYIRKYRRGRRLVEAWDDEDRELGIDPDEAKALYEDEWDEDVGMFDDPDDDPDSYQPWEVDEEEDVGYERKHTRGRPRGHRRGDRYR